MASAATARSVVSLPSGAAASSIQQPTTRRCPAASAVPRTSPFLGLQSLRPHGTREKLLRLVRQGLCPRPGSPYVAAARPGRAMAITSMQDRVRVLDGKSKYTIAVLPGDGQGPQVMEVAKKVLAALSTTSGVDFEFREGHVGLTALEKTGSILPEDTISLCKSVDAVLLGGLSGKILENDDVPLRSRVLKKLRSEMDLYCQLSPAKAFEQLLEDYSLKVDSLRGTDMIIVREIGGGIYTGQQGREDLPSGGQRAFSTASYTREEVERIAHAAFGLARQRKRQLVSVDLANYLEVSVFWREIFTRVGKEEYPDVELRHELADDFATRLVQNPARYDVVSMGNLLGDILVESARGITGGKPMSPTAEFGAPGTPGIFGYPGSYETVQVEGTKETANPLGLIRSVSMMLRYQFEKPVLADLVQEAIKSVLADKIRTPDMVVVPKAPDHAPFSVWPKLQTVDCEEMGDRLVQAMEYYQGFKVTGNPVEVGE
eukprot:TRINITY_DN17844_c0_g1_i1.p1 TRINITY_DN17844_c0_g1~~TRINITY_DN17844_c0_g1_i1.p1  ORF type:complete len:488 (-),score=110.13 TRINITY_DN17844_c0_g1_i1:362-1825(-)